MELEDPRVSSRRMCELGGELVHLGRLYQERPPCLSTNDQESVAGAMRVIECATGVLRRLAERLPLATTPPPGKNPEGALAKCVRG